MAQNSLRYSWSREEVDAKLKEIMNEIHSSCLYLHGQEKKIKLIMKKGQTLQVLLR